MGLEVLEFLERIDVRVLVVEVHDKPDRHQIVVEAIEERPAAGLVLRSSGQPNECCTSPWWRCLSGATCQSSFNPMPNFCDCARCRGAAFSSVLVRLPRAPSANNADRTQLHAAGEIFVGLPPMPMSPVATPLATAPSAPYSTSTAANPG